MRSLLAALVLSLLVLPLSARAQTSGDAAAPLEDRPATEMNEVERGLFFGAEAGGFFLFGPKGDHSGFSGGRSIGVTAGYDIGEMVSVGLLVLGTHTDTPANFVSDNSMRGDFSSLTLGATAKFLFLGFPDVNGVKRLFLYARGGGGLGLMGPKGIYASDEVLLFGGLGCELFTHLRHFSVGIDADFVYGLSNMGAGVMVNPSLRYSF